MPDPNPKPVAPADEDQITDLDTGGGADESTADEDADKADTADLGDTST